VRIGTFNIRRIMGSDVSGPWSRTGWDRRREPVAQAITALDPDILTLQEADTVLDGRREAASLALDWFGERLAIYGQAATDPALGFPFSLPILYRRSRMDLVEEGWLILAAPDVAGRERATVATWARFRDRKGDGRTLTVLNTHLDFDSWRRRQRAARTAAEWLRGRIAAGEVVAMAADLNALPGEPVPRLLERSGLAILPVAGATFHFGRGLDLYGAIDAIGHGPGLVPAGPAVVLRQRFGGVWPSDHYPVVADLMWSPPDRA